MFKKFLSMVAAAALVCGITVAPAYAADMVELAEGYGSGYATYDEAYAAAAAEADAVDTTGYENIQVVIDVAPNTVNKFVYLGDNARHTMEGIDKTIGLDEDGWEDTYWLDADGNQNGYAGSGKYDVAITYEEWVAYSNGAEWDNVDKYPILVRHKWYSYRDITTYDYDWVVGGSEVVEPELVDLNIIKVEGCNSVEFAPGTDFILHDGQCGYVYVDVNGDGVDQNLIDYWYDHGGKGKDYTISGTEVNGKNFYFYVDGNSVTKINKKSGKPQDTISWVICYEGQGSNPVPFPDEPESDEPEVIDPGYIEPAPVDTPDEYTEPEPGTDVTEPEATEPETEVINPEPEATEPDPVVEPEATEPTPVEPEAIVEETDGNDVPDPTVVDPAGDTDDPGSHVSTAVEEKEESNGTSEPAVVAEPSSEPSVVGNDDAEDSEAVASVLPKTGDHFGDFDSFLAILITVCIGIIFLSYCRKVDGND